MTALTIVDSDILIDAAQKIEAAIDCLARIENQSVLAVSVITQMELIVGCRNKAELRHTERFLQRFRVIKLSETMDDRTSHTRLASMRRQPRTCQAFDHASAGVPYGRNFSRRPSSSL